MKKRFLILCSVLVLLVALAAPAFAAVPDSLEYTKWTLRNSSPDISSSDSLGTYYINFTSGSEKHTSISFRSNSSGSKDIYSIYIDDVIVFQKVRQDSLYDITVQKLSDYSDLVITGGKDVKNENLISILSKVYNFTGYAPRPVYNAVPDVVTGDLSGYLEIIGSILTALFTPSGDLFQLGIVIAVCFGGAVIYGGVRLFRKLTPGV